MSVPTKTVPVTVPTWVWGRLATIAANRKTTVAALVADAVADIVNGTEDVRTPRRVHLPGNDRLEQLRAELRAARLDGYRPPRTEQRAKFTRERRLTLLAEVARLHADGLTDVEIAKQLGIGDETARRYRLQQGLPVIGRAGRPANDKENAA